MNLFGKSEVQKLIDLDYKTESHTFSKGVIAAYYNLLEYPSEVGLDYIGIKRKKGKVHFLLTPGTPIMDLKKDTVYSQVKTDICKVKTKEVVYDLEKIFTKPSKQVRRGINLMFRQDMKITTLKGIDLTNLYNEWAQHKMDDPKVYRIAFTPKRYLRSFQLAENGFYLFGSAYYVKGELYGAICYSTQGDMAFELAFISRYWRKDLKITNDLNELILINSFYHLQQNGIKKVNVGPTAGIRGLKTFKAKLPSEELIIYSN